MESSPPLVLISLLGQILIFPSVVGLNQSLQTVHAFKLISLTGIYELKFILPVKSMYRSSFG